MANSSAVEEIWVNSREDAEFTGYNRLHVQKLARDNWNLPEAEQIIRVRKRSNGYDIWLPDLFNYIEPHGIAPTSVLYSLKTLDAKNHN